MAVKTCLTRFQEKSLQNYFGAKHFSLLYKASIHGFSEESLFQRCCNQGPTITVMYNKKDVTGVYMRESYQEEKAVSIIVFALLGTEVSACKVGLYVPSALFLNFKRKGVFLNEFMIDLNSKNVSLSSKIHAELKLSGPYRGSIEECEVFRCEDSLNERRRKGLSELKEDLLSFMKTYKPYGDLVHQTRILLLGPMGAGKSSFFNSVKSIFQGHVTHQALVGSDASGVSDKYRTYPIRNGKEGKLLPFILCDSLGLGENAGLCTEDVVSILKGHVPDRYQFNSMKPITSHHKDYIHSPLLKDRIHCVAFVFDANSIDELSGEIVAKVKKIRREMIKHGTMHVALLTHVDIDLDTESDPLDIYNSESVMPKLQATHKTLGFPLSDIFVVSNYVSEWELDLEKDILTLSALRQMLWAADDFLEDSATQSFSEET